MISARVPMMVSRLVEGTNYHPLWLGALSQLTEAVILYDRVLFFDPHPLSLAQTLSLMGCETVATLNAEDPDTLLPVHDLAASDDLTGAMAAVRAPRFRYRMFGSPALHAPQEHLDEADALMPAAQFRDSVKEAMRLAGVEPTFESFRPPDRTMFERYFAANRRWQIHSARQAAVEHGAHGVLYPPDLTPLVDHERNQLRSELHRQFKDFEDRLWAVHGPRDLALNVAPLTTVLLDTSLTRERIPLTLSYMRRDYHELRAIGRNYRRAIHAAETHRDLSEIKEEWVEMWKRFMGRVGRPRVPLIRRVLGWDLLLKSSVRDLGKKLLDAVREEVAAAPFRTSMSLASELEDEFLGALTADRSIQKLFFPSA